MNSTSLSPLSAPGLVTPRALGGPSGASAPSVGLGVRAPRPPRGLYLPHGTPRQVSLGGLLPPSGGRTVVQRLGLAYEQKVQDILQAIYGEKFFCDVPILYEDRRGLHRCIPDGVLRTDACTVVIVEVKLRHTSRAWWQLERLYFPVLRQLVGPSVRIQRAEICRSYDPDEEFGPHDYCESLHKLPSDRVGVLQWKL